jgi:hypothetical protein
LHKFQIVLGKLLTIGGAAGAILLGSFVARAPYLWPPFLMSLVGLGVGLSWVIKASKADELQIKRKRDQFALMLARDRSGRLTVVELTTASGWSIDDSKEVLDRLVIADVADVNVTTNGELVYAFRGLLSPEQKETARDPLVFEVEG